MDVDRYSFSLTTFSPSGKLVQIEYALHAVNAGGTALGIKATDGVVIATEKKLPELMDETSIQKVNVISRHVGVVYAGLGPDYRQLLKEGRKIAQVYYQTYKEDIPVLQLVRQLAYVMQEYTQEGGVRPFGVSLLVAGWDRVRGHQLYQADPSGSYWAWKASAIGKNMASGRSFLEKRYKDSIGLQDAIHTSILTLKEGMEGEMTDRNVEIGVVAPATDDKGNPCFRFRVLAPEDVRDNLELS